MTRRCVCEGELVDRCHTKLYNYCKSLTIKQPSAVDEDGETHYY